MKNKGVIVIKEEMPHMLEQDHEFDHKELKEIEKSLNKIGYEAALPIGKGDELVAVIFLGKKKSKDAFTVDDIRFLEKLTGQALFGLGNAVLYRDAIMRIKETYVDNA